MDRQTLGLDGPIPDNIVMRAIAFEELGPVDGLAGLIDVMAELRAGLGDGRAGHGDGRAGHGDRRAGHDDRFDLLWLGDGPPAGWEHLGFDVGETTSTAWSAIARWSTFMSPAEAGPWHARLNDNGLFTHRQDARLYLEHYLGRDDPRPWLDLHRLDR